MFICLLVFFLSDSFIFGVGVDVSDSFIFGVGVDVVRVCCNLVELGIGFDMLMFVGVFGFVVVDVFNVIEVRRLFLGELYWICIRLFISLRR